MKTKSIFLHNLKEAAGIIGVACEQTGISRTTYYHWCKEDEEFKEKAEDIIEGQVDFVENRLLKKIQDGDTTAIIFYLKTKGKKRGYTEKLPQQPQPDNKPSVNITLPPQTEAANKKQIEGRIKAKKQYIVRLLKEQGKYTAELTYQVELTAQLLVRVDMLKEEIFSAGYKPINVEYSREGNERLSVNPKEKLYLEFTEKGQKALRALGMNTESKERKTDNDSFNDFLNEFKE